MRKNSLEPWENVCGSNKAVTFTFYWSQKLLSAPNQIEKSERVKIWRLFSFICHRLHFVDALKRLSAHIRIL